VPEEAGNQAGGGDSSQRDSDAAIFLFDTTHAAMEAEEAIIDGGFWCDVVPRPPETKTTLCGLAIEVNSGDEGDVAKLLDRARIAYQVHHHEDAAHE
jgi:hypothetical protein